MQRRRREFDLDLLAEEAAAHETAEVAVLARLEPAGELPATREAVARTAQQRAGNRAVSGVLARDPNPKLRKAPPARPPKPPLREGREVDAIFDSSPYATELVGAKLGKSTLEKATVIDEEPAFETAWLEYAQRSVNPATGKTFTEEDARAYMKSQGVRAFQDEVRGKIHLRKEKADLGTQLHEGLHLFSDDRWKKNMNYRANEGVTEYFTRKLAPEVKVERDDNSFLREFTSATHLVEVAGEHIVAAAYFDGDIGSLEKKIDGRKADGAGTWKKWLAYLEAENYKAANALLAT
jgi:hypothetical protein